MERFALARSLILEAGAALRQSSLEEREVQHKTSYQDLVTRWDRETEQFLRKNILERFPEDIIVGEEYPASPGRDGGCVWYIDPIDGTTNFIKGYQHSAISVALAKDKKIIIGVVYDPDLDNLFYAQEGKGAYLNGKPIHVSDCSIEKSLVLFGT